MVDVFWINQPLYHTSSHFFISNFKAKNIILVLYMSSMSVKWIIYSSLKWKIERILRKFHTSGWSQSQSQQVFCRFSVCLFFCKSIFLSLSALSSLVFIHRGSTLATACSSSDVEHVVLTTLQFRSVNQLVSDAIFRKTTPRNFLKFDMKVGDY